LFLAGFFDQFVDLAVVHMADAREEVMGLLNLTADMP
jgi:hypothetical protein